jgi:predicted nucleic acid-binding protein
VILALDTDVLVSWVMAGAPRHRAAVQLVDIEARQRDAGLAIAPQVMHEFLHVATDPRRFENPLSMPEGLRWARNLWSAKEVVRIVPAPGVLDRTLELLERHRLGRKRILDTALAATLELAGVRRLATFNPGDFRPFSVLELVGSPAQST